MQPITGMSQALTVTAAETTNKEERKQYAAHANKLGSFEPAIDLAGVYEASLMQNPVATPRTG